MFVFLLLPSFPHTALAGEQSLFALRSFGSKRVLSAEELQLGRVPGQGDFSMLRGWDYLYQKLVAAGVSPLRVQSLLSDARMPVHQGLSFSIKPVEPRAIYRRHNSRQARRNALNFYEKFRAEFIAAEKEYAVPREVILAILQVETACGANTGRSAIFPQLARLAMAAEPANITRLTQRNGESSRQAFEARAKWLEEKFFPHTLAALKLADSLQVDPFDVRGSSAGALGLPQFLPGNISQFGVDANEDQAIDLFSPEDAILSVGRYLHAHGWTKKNLARREQREVIYHYNRSNSYVDTVLAMAGALAKEMK